MSEIKHTMSDADFEWLAPRLVGVRDHVTIKDALAACGIAVEEPPRATVTREEFDKVCAGVGIYAGCPTYAYVEDVQRGLNIRVVP